MWRWTAVLLLCLLCQYTSPVHGESPPSTSLLARTGWARFRLVLGRIEVANIHSSQTRTVTSGGEGDDLFEKLNISGDTDVPSVRYERVTPDEFISLAVIDGDRVEIDRDATLSKKLVPIKYRQRPKADVILRVGADSDLRTYRAPTLWHLMLDAPDVCRTHLLPLLELLQPSWDLEGTLIRSTDQLIRRAAESDFRSRHSVRRSIAKLNSADFAIRRQAQERLCQLGIGILPYLNQLATSELTREQRERIDQIRTTLRGREGDSPERLALWLVEDERAWVAMLDHDELPIRQFASDHLAKRFAKPISFDPEGTPRERLQQIARIRTRIERR